MTSRSVTLDTVMSLGLVLVLSLGLVLALVDWSRRQSDGFILGDSAEEAGSVGDSLSRSRWANSTGRAVASGGRETSGSSRSRRVGRWCWNASGCTSTGWGSCSVGRVGGCNTTGDDTCTSSNGCSGV